MGRNKTLAKRNIKFEDDETMNSTAIVTLMFVFPVLWLIICMGISVAYPPVETGNLVPCVDGHNYRIDMASLQCYEKTTPKEGIYLLIGSGIFLIALELLICLGLMNYK